LLRRRLRPAHGAYASRLHLVRNHFEKGRPLRQPPSPLEEGKRFLHAHLLASSTASLLQHLGNEGAGVLRGRWRADSARCVRAPARWTRPSAAGWQVELSTSTPLAPSLGERARPARLRSARRPQGRFPAFTFAVSRNVGRARNSDSVICGVSREGGSKRLTSRYFSEKYTLRVRSFW